MRISGRPVSGSGDGPTLGTVTGQAVLLPGPVVYVVWDPDRPDAPHALRHDWLDAVVPSAIAPLVMA
jgi:hypothetical protein